MALGAVQELALPALPSFPFHYGQNFPLQMSRRELFPRELSLWFDTESLACAFSEEGCSSLEAAGLAEVKAQKQEREKALPWKHIRMG